MGTNNDKRQEEITLHQLLMLSQSYYYEGSIQSDLHMINGSSFIVWDDPLLIWKSSLSQPLYF